MEQTSVRQKWVVETLHMGSAPYVSRLAKLMGERVAREDRAMRTLKNEIVNVLSQPLFPSVHTLERSGDPSGYSNAPS